MRAWKIDTLHGPWAVDVCSVTWRGVETSVVSLRRPEAVGGTKQSLVPRARALQRARWIVAAAVRRLQDTNMAG